MKSLALAAVLAAAVVRGPVPNAHRASPYVGAIAVEATTGRVLVGERADRECYPASCTKLMTARLLLKAVRDGTVAPDEQLVQSRRSAQEQPSKIDLLPGETISVRNAMTALMLKSANDVAVIVAERLGGSVEGFAQMMNDEAAALGMTRTHFVSPNGLPPPKGSTRGFDRSTAADLAKLGVALVKEQPEILAFTKMDKATIPGRGGAPLTVCNHNNLLWKKSVKVDGVDGLKTGYIDAGGSSIVLTGTRDGHRAVVVVVGSAGAKERDAHAARLLNDALGALAW